MKNKRCYPMQTLPCLKYTTTKNIAAQDWKKSADFGFRSPVVPKTFQTKVLPLSQHASSHQVEIVVNCRTNSRFPKVPTNRPIEFPYLWEGLLKCGIRFCFCFCFWARTLPPGMADFARFANLCRHLGWPSAGFANGTCRLIVSHEVLPTHTSINWRYVTWKERKSRF